MSRVGILLLNWNGWQDTCECLESLLRLAYPDFRIVVCDNASDDGSVERISEWAARGNAVSLPEWLGAGNGAARAKPLQVGVCDREAAEAGGNPEFDPLLTVIRTGGNLGFAGGNNVGLRYLLARGGFDYVWLLNNDTVVPPDSLSHLVARAGQDARTGICGSTLLYYHDPQRVQAWGGGYYCRWIGLPWLFGRWRRHRPVQGGVGPSRWMNYVVGASMLVSRQFIEEVGLMTEDYFLFFEETDWAWRGRPRFRLDWAPESLVYHKVGSSIGTSTNPRRKSLTCDFYALRNRTLFTRRHCPAALPAIHLSLAAAATLRLLCGRREHAKLAWDLFRGREAGWEQRIRGSGSA